MIELEQMQSLIKREDLQEAVDLNEKKVQPNCEVHTRCNYNCDVHAPSFEIEDEDKWGIPVTVPSRSYVTVPSRSHS